MTLVEKFRVKEDSSNLQPDRSRTGREGRGCCGQWVFMDLDMHVDVSGRRSWKDGESGTPLVIFYLRLRFYVT